MKSFYRFYDLNTPNNMVLFRLRLWLKRSLPCKFGKHIFDWNEYGIPLCGSTGVVDFFCKRCQKRIKTIPFDDLPEDEQKKKFQFLEETKGE